MLRSLGITLLAALGISTLPALGAEEGPIIPGLERIQGTENWQPPRPADVPPRTVPQSSGPSSALARPAAPPASARTPLNAPTGQLRAPSQPNPLSPGAPARGAQPGANSNAAQRARQPATNPNAALRAQQSANMRGAQSPAARQPMARPNVPQRGAQTRPAVAPQRGNLPAQRPNQQPAPRATQGQRGRTR